MKFKSTVYELQKTLKLLTAVVNYNHSVLAFRYLKVFVNNGKLEIKGFDNSFVASVFPQFSEIEDDGVYGLVLAKQFISLINTFKSEEISVSIDGNICHIKSGRSNYKLPLLEEEKFLSSVGPLDLAYYDIEYKNKPIKLNSFLNRAEAVSHCLSKDDYHANLQHIYIKDNKMIACDSVKGAVIDFENESLDDYLIHRKVISCLNNVSDTNEAFFTVEGSNLYVKAKNFIFAASLEKIVYPYEMIKRYIGDFQEVKSYIINLSTEEFADKLGRVLMFADSETNSVQIAFQEKEISLIVSNNSYAEEKISSLGQEFKKPFVLYVDGKSLRESLAKAMSNAYWHTDGEEEVQFIYDGELLQFFLGLTK